MQNTVNLYRQIYRVDYITSQAEIIKHSFAVVAAYCTPPLICGHKAMMLSDVCLSDVNLSVCLYRTSGPRSN